MNHPDEHTEDDWKPPVPHKSYRLSSHSSRLSGISQVSVLNAEIGEAVSVPMWSLDSQQHGLNTRQGSETTDEESVYSEGQMKLGRLNTITGKNPTTGPQMVVSTHVDDVVPPRSRRRPVSDIITGAPAPSRGRDVSHRFSLSITDDLERLMESAHSLRSGLPEPDAAEAIAEAEAAEEKTASFSKEVLPLPQLQKLPQFQKESLPQYLQESLSSGPWRHSHAPSAFSADTFETADEPPAVPAHRVFLGSQKLPKRPTPQNMERARVASQQYSLKSGDLSGELSEDDTVQPEQSEPAAETANADDVEVGHAGQEGQEGPDDEGHDDEWEAEPEDAPRDVSPCGSPRGSSRDKPRDASASAYASADASAFASADASDPVVKPVRARSVKQNTQPGKRGKKRRSKTGTRAKPFSYNTLVHLLESINGTVIGEEFDTLSLPVREKQMIEKIIDSLSRLTSDMVLDENRYDAGLLRLEQAHRALEGFP